MLSGAAGPFLQTSILLTVTSALRLDPFGAMLGGAREVESAYGSQSEAECTHHKHVCQSNEMCGEWELMMHHAYA